MINGNFYPTTFDETTAIEDIEAALPANELDELDAIGDQRDDTRWRVGDMARLWIDERGFPTQQCLVIIGRRTDWGTESIKKFLACSRFYFERPDLRRQYDILKHSIFDHARQCFDPEEVLRAALEKQMRPQTVKNTFLPLMDELKDAYNRVPKTAQQEARDIISIALGKLRELKK